MHGDARVRIGVCSDVHGRHDRLLAVLAAMAAAGVDERWCLGDLVGREPVTAELVGAASQLDLLIAGNHDAWALGPDRVVARGRDVFRLSSRGLASRSGIDCWDGTTRRPASFTAAPHRARCALSGASLTTGSQPVPSWPTRGLSAATHATRRAGG